ncbi:MAG: glycogen/starch/alpha-glucan phosphorylase [Cyanobacteria bacterium J06642_2]
MTASQPVCPPCEVTIEDDRTGVSVETLKRAFTDNLFYVQGKFPALATKNDYYMALAYTVRDRLLRRWLKSAEVYTDRGSRTVCYLSAEFLMGPHLGNNLINLDIYDTVKQAMDELGLDLEELMEQEEEPGLGNGGLGRLAACYLDSLASLEIPTLGYGIRYEFGIFDQTIRDGWQVEITDKWLQFGNPWELPRPDWAVEVKLGGYTETFLDDKERYRVRWVPDRVVKGIPYDTPILGYKVNTANTLRLWKAEAAESFDFATFNRGDYYGAVDAKVVSENISKVLYPNDEQAQGKQLRLEQQFFFVSCSLQDMLRIMETQHIPLERFHEKFVLQLNDTHPAIAVAELMRLLVDERGIDWEPAWAITQQAIAYTNHTLLPEALEKWAVDLFEKLLPRHLQIIYEINHRFLDVVRIKFLGDDHVTRMSLIGEDYGKSVRMAHLACAGSFAINGVAELHSELLKQDVLRDFYALWPEKFTNVTNGVTPRRWIVLSNPRLSDLITRKIGNNWINHLDDLRQLEAFVEDASFREEWHHIKQSIKRDFATFLFKKHGLTVNPDSLYDVHVKRIHEYKRQHLNALHIISLYSRLKHNRSFDIPPRTFIFGGKAAPGYFMAKLVIKLITSIAAVIDADPDVRDRLKVVFIPDYNVKTSQHIYPAADLSEQISTAGKEASGTGNMKFSMNGALTIGTLDGANVEIREEVGAENFFLFGLTAEQVRDLKHTGYQPRDYFYASPLLKDAIELIQSGFFSHGDPELFKPLIDNLLYHDPYLVLADFQAYADCQHQVGEVYRDRDRWTRMSILNSARTGKFSSDRSIRDYCKNIWHVDPVSIDLDETTSLPSALA